MKGVEEKRRVRNNSTRDVCFHGSNKYTKGLGSDNMDRKTLRLYN